MNSPMLSFIIPAFNAEKYIKKCINSILAIKSEKIEIIVINDGSQDHTLKTVHSINDSRLRCYSIKNGGVSRARNYGISKAKGEYICFVDADDTIITSSFSEMFSSLKENIDVLMFGYRCENGSKIIEFKPCFSDGIYDYSVAKEIMKRMLDLDFAKRYRATYIGGKVYQYIINRKVLEKNKFVRFDENLPFAEDMCFLVTLLNCVRNIQINSKICYNYIFYQGTASHRYRPNYWNELTNVCSYIKKLNILTNRELSRIYYRYVRDAILHYTKWSKSKRKALKQYEKIIDTGNFAKCLKTIDYNDWTYIEKIENMSILKKWYRIIYALEKIKQVKRRIARAL